MKYLAQFVCVIAVVVFASVLVACSSAESSGSSENSGSSESSSSAESPATASDDAQSTGSSASQSSESVQSSASQPAESAGDPLGLWNDDAPLKKKLVDFVEAATDESSSGFIPVEDRIATFDFDGTLFCETDPNYFDYTLLVYRVLEDANYKDKASDFEKSVAAKIVDQNENGTKYEELPVEHGQAVASSF
ncbi:MAG: hypothetical protein IJ087_19215 [Eggerthellaceae bacterium]|nr:hypothetical protein [Eggerthellaceae bacterium]